MIEKGFKIMPAIFFFRMQNRNIEVEETYRMPRGFVEEFGKDLVKLTDFSFKSIEIGIPEGCNTSRGSSRVVGSTGAFLPELFPSLEGSSFLHFCLLDKQNLRVMNSDQIFHFFFF